MNIDSHFQKVIPSSIKKPVVILSRQIHWSGGVIFLFYAYNVCQMVWIAQAMCHKNTTCIDSYFSLLD